MSMKTQIKIFLGSTILMAIVFSLLVNGVGVGHEVTDPNDCDSGRARYIPSSNNTLGSLYCMDSTLDAQWAFALDTIQNISSSVSAAPISEEAIVVQMSLAETSTIWTDADEIYWHFKFDGFNEEGILGIKEYSKIAWIYIWAFFTLVLEIIKLIFYLVEILLVIYIFFTLIPETFFRLRDSIVKSYIKRYAT